MSGKRFFKIMLTVIAVMFFFTCFSIIFCLVNSSEVNEAQSSSHLMSIVYLFLHLLIEAAIFYYSFKAMVKGSSLLKVVMYNDNGEPNKKSRRNSIIVICVSSVIAIYSAIIVFFNDIFLGFFALGLKFALLNFFALLAVLGTFFLTYRLEEK